MKQKNKKKIRFCTGTTSDVKVFKNPMYPVRVKYKRHGCTTGQILNEVRSRPAPSVLPGGPGRSGKLSAIGPTETAAFVL